MRQEKKATPIDPIDKPMDENEIDVIDSKAKDILKAYGNVDRLGLLNIPRRTLLVDVLYLAKNISNLIIPKMKELMREKDA